MARRPKRRLAEIQESSLSDEVDDVSEDVITHLASVQNPRNRAESWLEYYAPKSPEDVSINPSKLKEVRTLIHEMLGKTSDCRLLILSGPAGASKSTLVKALAKQLLPQTHKRESIIEYANGEIDGLHHPEHFAEFLDGCRYRIGDKKGVVLVEDLPNVFHEATLNGFRRSLESWVYSSRGMDLPPVILCVTEVELVGEARNRGYFNLENCFTVETLLGTTFLRSGLATGLIKRVKFLPIAKRFLKKTVDRIIAKEKAHCPDPSFLQSIYESGDIRSSIGALELWNRSGGAFNFKEQQITLFHAVGKVLFSSTKTISAPDQEYSEDYQSIQMVIEGYSNFGLLHLALLENYSIVSGLQYDINTAADVVESLSTNDILQSVPESRDYAIRAVRNALRHLRSSGSLALKMRFPQHFKVLREESKCISQINDYRRYLVPFPTLVTDANLIDGFLLPKIYNSFKYRHKNGRSRYMYNRLGGSFKRVFVDDAPPILEEDLPLQAERDQFMDDIENKIASENAAHVKESDEMSESIEESQSGTDDELDDTLDDGILQLSRQGSTRGHAIFQGEQDDLSDLMNDPEIDFLISQGVL